MGCCSSKTNSSAARSDDSNSSAPPFPPEQESVKEVLSETPLPKSQFPITIQDAADNYNKLITWGPPEEISAEINVSDHSPAPVIVNNEKWEISEEVRQCSPAKFRNRPASPGRVDGQRRDSREISGRKSRSPVTRVSSGGGGGTNLGLSRNPSSRRKTGKSPGRARSEPEKCRKEEEEEDKLKWPPMVNESLENPMVSLECFIFL